jgi:two-component system, response regulator
MQRKTLEVLLVEDNADDANLIAQTLKDYHPGISVIAVEDGVQALDCLFGTGSYAANGPCTPHLILLDAILPKVSGLEVLRVIRAYSRTRVIPVVILSASSEQRRVLESYQLGVNSYLVKPGDVDQFRQMIRQIVAYWMSVIMPVASDDALNPTNEDGSPTQPQGPTAPSR